MSVERIWVLMTDEDFKKLLPLIEEFAMKADLPLWQQVREVAESLINQAYLTIFGEEKGKRGYLCGYLIDPKTFMISQCYSPLPSLTASLLSFLEERLKETEVEELISLFKHHPKVAERHGFKLDRYLVSRKLKKEV